MKSLEFFAVGEPKAQPRPRAFVRGGHAGMYDPGTARDWKCTVREAASEVWDGKPFEGPISVRLKFIFRRPKSHYGTGKNSKAVKDSSPRWHTQKPDIDNAAKAVMDALTDLGLWRDDSQICSLGAGKVWGDLVSSSVGVGVTVTELESVGSNN